mmetsp:Transcript_17620/g.68401  ORF Transcript_17620/g.68401 Transcript_17620/m.68401 type:complete len:498 (+) Transcript_17620:96-1589(+)
MGPSHTGTVGVFQTASGLAGELQGQEVGPELEAEIQTLLTGPGSDSMSQIVAVLDAAIRHRDPTTATFVADRTPGRELHTGADCVGILWRASELQDTGVGQAVQRRLADAVSELPEKEGGRRQADQYAQLVYLACQHGYEELLRAIAVEAPASFHSAACTANTAQSNSLFIAAQYGHTGCVNVLLDFLTDSELRAILRASCTSPLHAAMWDGPTALVLIERLPIAALATANRMGKSPLIAALERGLQVVPTGDDVVLSLIARLGKDHLLRHPGALHVAVREGRERVALELMRMFDGHPDAFTARYLYNTTPLHMVTPHTTAGILAALLDRVSEDALMETELLGSVPLYSACLCLSLRDAGDDTLEMVGMIADASPPHAFAQQNHIGRTPLHIICSYFVPAQLSRLLPRCPPEAYLVAARDGDTPLHSAMGALAMSQVLESKNRDPVLEGLTELFEHAPKEAWFVEDATGQTAQQMLRGIDEGAVDLLFPVSVKGALC